MEKKTIVSENTIPYFISDEEVQDIDNLSDWMIAEAKYKVINGL